MRFPLAAAVAAALLASASGALAQQAPQGTPVNVRGTIVGVDGNVLTVNTGTSTAKVALPDGTRVQYVIKSDFSKIGPGTFIGTAAVPQADGTYRALEIQLFDQANHPVARDGPFDIAPQSTMTNATISTMTDASVAGVQGRILTLKWNDGEKKIFVPADAPVTTTISADKSALTAGASTHVFAVKGEDGSLTARAVLVGKDGLKVPY